MFDFCKPVVCQKAKLLCILISKLLSSKKFDRTTNDQVSRVGDALQDKPIIAGLRCVVATDSTGDVFNKYIKAFQNHQSEVRYILSSHLSD
jgi:hypothetical protein